MNVLKNGSIEDIVRAISKLKRHQAELACELDEHEHVLKSKLVEERNLRCLKLDYIEIKRTPNWN